MDLCWQMSLLFNMLSKLVITFLPRNKSLLISWLQSPFSVILEPPKIKFLTVSIVFPSNFFSKVIIFAKVNIVKALQYCFCFMFWFFFFGCEAYRILASWPGIEPAPPAWQGEVLTTEPPGKSQLDGLRWHHLNLSHLGLAINWLFSYH